MASVPSSPQKDLQDLRKSRRESVVPDRPSLLSPTTPVSSPLASTSWGLASTSSILISKKVSRKSSKNAIPPLPQNGAYIRRGSTSAALMNSSNSLWQTLVKTKHGPFPGIDATKDSVNNNDPKASLIEKKKAALSRRTNSLVELAAKTSKQSNEKSEESLPSTHSSPLRPNGLLKRDMRFCCSFRRPRRAKTSSNLLENKNKQPNVPPFGLVNASAMSLINDPSVARQAISLLEAQMKPNPETVKMLVEEEKAVEEGQEVKRPHGLESITSPLRKLSKAFFNSQNNDRIDLMNDWEIGGTQNAWVCPSDRHLQLRAQLKSGWSVRTATARSPTTTKAAAMNGISDAEQEQIRKVLARAEAGKQQEKERIGKMVDRLEKMKTRASGNGVTQCLICQTEFGLLASKSYAAMCSDCRKYVCQKNCGVETFDQKRGEPIFLCKLCSEYREVMWKKSGAWFYKEVPTYVKPCDSPASSSAYPPVNGYRHMPNVPSTASPSSGWPSGFSPSPRLSHGNVVSPPVVEQNGGIPGAHGAPRQRQLPIPPDQQQRLKTTPRPRITPSWVHEKVQSSMSIGSEDEESSSSSIDAIDFKTPISNQVPSQQPQPLPPSRRHHYRPREYRHNQSPSQQPTTTSSSCASSSTAPRNLQRFTVSNRNPITDTEESENDESRRTTPSTSPRHSLATPSSFGGDDLSQNHVTLITNEASDSKSIDSGASPMHNSCSSSSSPPPSLPGQVPLPEMRAMNLNKDPKTSLQHMQSNHIERQPQWPGSSPRNSNTVPSLFQQTAPPLPPRHGQSVGNVDRRPSSGSSSTNNSMARRNMQSNPNSSRESLNITPAAALAQSQLSLTSKPRPPSVHSTDRKSSITVGSRESLSLAPTETDRPAESPTFMSSPEDDSSTLGSIQFNLTYLSEEKQLIIHLIRAKNLKAMDKNGFSDPYVKFHLIPGNVKATKLTSKTIEKTLNPEWNEEMIYYGITEDERLKKTLRVTVLDRDRIGSDFLGETRVALKKLPLGQTKKFNLYLEHAMPTPAEQSENTERGKILMSVCYNIQQACLFIHVKRCAELMGMDSSGFSDPYCKVSLTPLSSKQHRYKTAIKKRTLNPEFNEVIQFIVPFKDLPKKTLEIGVYDHDVGRHDDYIGGIVLSTAAKGDRGKQWTQCIENPGKTFEYWHKLETD